MEQLEQWQPSLDLQQCEEWLTLLLPDNGGYANIVSTGNWEGRVFDTNADDYPAKALDYIAALDSQGAKGIYLRVPPLKDIPGQFKRGGINDSKSLQCLWLDMDIEGPGHKERPLKEGQKPPLPLPPDEKTCRKILKHSGLPDPTLWIHSGGGLYPVWFFKQYVDLTLDGTTDTWQNLSQQWHTVVQRAAADVGWRYDPSTYDLARVLRIPGTVNRKVDGAPTQARFFHREIGADTLDAATVPTVLADRLERWPDPEPSRPAAIPAQERIAATGVEKPGDAYNREMTPDRFFHEILEPEGWTFHSQDRRATYLTRPGKNPRAGLSASLDLDGSGSLFVMSSDAAPLPAGEKITPFQAYTLFHHGGDHKAAARDLGRRGFGTPLAQTTTSFDAYTVSYEPTPNVTSSAVSSATTSPAAEDTVGQPPIPTNTTSAFNPKWRKHTLDDRGNGRRLWDRLHKTIRWVPKQGKWAVWDRNRWILCSVNGAEALEMAGVMTDDLLAEEGGMYSQTPGEGSQGRETMSEYDRFARHVSSSRALPRMRAMLEILKGLPGISVGMEAFDKDKAAINVRNGILNLVTKELTAHDPDALMMNLINVDWNPDASAPMFEQFLARCQPDESMRHYLMQIMGYSLTGFTSAQAIFIHLGSGANGKSTFAELMAGIVGTYHQAVPSSTLLTSYGDRIPSDVARMEGKRFLVLSETAKHRTLDEERMKQLTGMDTVSARPLYGEFADFKPTGKMHLFTNHMPNVSDAPSTWRRMKVIHWDVVIPTDEWIDDLGQRIVESEAEGVLRLLVDGAHEWLQARRFTEPMRVTEATKAQREDQDVLGDFIHDKFVVKEEGFVSTTQVNAIYQEWAKQYGQRFAMNQKQLVQALLERPGIRRDRTSTMRGIRGLQVKPAEKDVWLKSGVPVHAVEPEAGPPNSQPSLE